ncbi:nucleoid-associated protein Lsr2 [Amycolatopsis thailandensis]|uniref:Nucleoid-associated protein Lsr2 n=1 Tax=Amycolatopsis thailandensis TaxID=589330 RepID=A0A229SDR9_9PSEU|nr:Lsr2 family protein [Amycolatopsis thailandensis]OXM57048.1 nucleoid-associated protein Lsr2 [Amycolatopsis thailandensis]
MATKKSVITVDDIDGTPAVVTKKFNLDGVDYRIDLDQENADFLDEFLAPYVASARRVGGRRSQPQDTGTKEKAAPQKKTDTSDELPPNRVIRDWARKNGHNVSDRGRLSDQVIKKYLDANNPRKKGGRKRG